MVLQTITEILGGSDDPSFSFKILKETDLTSKTIILKYDGALQVREKGRKVDTKYTNLSAGVEFRSGSTKKKFKGDSFEV